MSTQESEMIRIVTYMFALAFCIVLSFGQMADYILRRKTRDLVAAFLFLTVASTFVFRIAALADIPAFPANKAADSIALTSLFTMVLALVWGVLRLWDHRRLEAKISEIKKEQEEERNGNHV